MGIIRGRVLTIGHSILGSDAFLTMLENAKVTAIADVRSSPYSRRLPHFNQDELRPALMRSGIKYVFLGKELGGRPRAAHLYCNGVADYEKMVLEPGFLTGIDRVIAGSQDHKIALMCSERNPLDCHRCLLVGRSLSERGISVGHILSNGHIAEQQDIEEQLLALYNNATDDMFSTHEETVSRAYRLRANAVAYRDSQPELEQPTSSNRHSYAR